MRSMTAKRSKPPLSAANRQVTKPKRHTLFSPKEDVMRSLQLGTGGRNKDEQQFATLDASAKRPADLINSYDTAKIGTMLSTMAKSSGYASTPRQSHMT